MVARAGPLATRNCESRQARKGAAEAVDVCAGVGTVRVAAQKTPSFEPVYIMYTSTRRNCRAEV